MLNSGSSIAGALHQHYHHLDAIDFAAAGSCVPAFSTKYSCVWAAHFYGVYSVTFFLQVFSYGIHFLHMHKQRNGDNVFSTLSLAYFKYKLLHI